MKRRDILMAFLAGFEAGRDKQSLIDSLSKFEATIPRRTRRWFKKPKKP